MTCCVGIKLEEGLIFASDSRTHAGVDNCAEFCMMTVFECASDRVLVLLSSGGVAGTQAVISVLRQRAWGKPPHQWTAGSMFDVASVVADPMRDIERCDGPCLEGGGLKFNASFILGGLLCYALDSLIVTMRRRFDVGDACFESLKNQWIAGTRKVFHDLPPLDW